MNNRPRTEGAPGDPEHGARTAAAGTPQPVDFSADRRARSAWVVFLAGPVIFFGHFMVVYLVVEAGCAGGGAGLTLFDPPIPTIVTLAATAVGAIATLGFAGWAYHRWRADDATSGSADSGAPGSEWDYLATDRAIAFGGFLLSMLSLVTILFVGLPALFLPAC